MEDRCSLPSDARCSLPSLCFRSSLAPEKRHLSGGFPWNFCNGWGSPAALSGKQCKLILPQVVLCFVVRIWNLMKLTHFPFPLQLWKRACMWWMGKCFWGRTPCFSRCIREQSPNILSVITHIVDRVATDGFTCERDTKKGTGLTQLAQYICVPIPVFGLCVFIKQSIESVLLQASQELF